MSEAENTDRFFVSTPDRPVSSTGRHIIIHTWSGSGPDYLHVHNNDDEAWYVIEGILTFRLGDSTVKAGPGTTVMAPAGTPHTYFEEDGPTKYLIILTPTLDLLISELHRTPYKDHGSVLRKYDSEIVGS